MLLEDIDPRRRDFLAARIGTADTGIPQIQALFYFTFPPQYA